MGLNGVVLGYPTSTIIPWVDRLSTDPWEMGCHSCSTRQGLRVGTGFGEFRQLREVKVFSYLI